MPRTCASSSCPVGALIPAAQRMWQTTGTSWASATSPRPYNVVFAVELVLLAADDSISDDATCTRKPAFYAHVLELLSPLLQDDGFSHSNWVTNLSNTSSLLYHCFMSYADAYGTTETGEAVVNWCGASSPS